MATRDYSCRSLCALPHQTARMPAARNAVWGIVLLLVSMAASAIVASASTPARSAVPARARALGASATQNNVTITQNFSSVYYVDTKTSPFPTGFYAAYNITNNSSSALSDVWVTLGNFTGSTVYLSLGGNDPGVVHLGSLAAGASKAAYFYLGVDCSSFTAGNCNISAAQGFTVDVYLGPPTSNLLAALTTNDITVFETIAASANKANSGSVSTTTPTLGGTFTVTENGSTGTIGGSNIFALSPETSASFPANSFHLVSTTLTFSNGGTGTFTDLLQIPTSVMSGISSASYTVTYTYEVTGTTTSTTTVQPMAYINSGAQIKHTSVSSLGNIPPIQPATNSVLLSMAVSPTSLGLSGGTVTYTIHVINAGGTAATMDEFVDALASSPDAEDYVTGSSQFAGSAIPDPTMAGSTLIWPGIFTIPADGTADLTFQTTIPETVGSYTDFSYGLISTSQIDTTYNTSDDAKATTTVTVSSQQTTTISISNIPSGATYGGSFTPSYAYIGDGTPSVTSNSTSVCTVTGGLVHFIALGTCSLTPSATAGTNYAAVTGTAQTFSVGQATPTISISNLPASGTYGGSFTPTFSYTGDGSTSVSSNSTSVCTVTSGVVHYVGVGTCSLTASATAGTNYAAVTGSAQTFSIGQATPTISISNLPASGTYGGSFTPTFSYTGDGTPSVTSNSTSVCTVTSGVVHYVGVGTCSLTASATAGTNYAAVTGTAQTFSVGQATPTISISNLPASGAYGGSFTPTFSYTGDGSTSVSSNSTSVCTVTSGVVHYVGVGTCSLTASATAGTNYAAVTGTAQTFSIGQATPTISISNLPASGTYGGSFTPTFSYTGDGTTSVSSNSTSVCTVTSGVVHYVGVGTCSLTPSATAGTNYAAVTGTAQTFSVGQATPTISISNLPASGAYGGSFTPTFSYTGDGTTSVSSNSTSICTVTSGVVHYVGVGTCSLTASATAGTNYAAVTGTAQTFSVGKATATLTLGNLSQTYTGSPLSVTDTTNPSALTVTFTYDGSSTLPTTAGAYTVVATINDANYQGTVTGTFTIAQDQPSITWPTPSAITYGTALGGVQLDATSSVAGTFSYAPASGVVLNAGANQTLSVILTPTDATDYANATQTVLITVNRAPVTVALASTADPADLQSQITLTATVNSEVGTPTGNVSFFDGNTLLGSSALSNGIGSFSTSSLPTGTHLVTAVYGGDEDFTASSSPVLSQVVIDFGVSPAPGSGGGSGGSQTVTPGGTATFTISITPTAGTTLPTITYLTVTGLPAGATATLTTPGWTQLTSTSWSLPALSQLSDVSLSFHVPPSQSGNVGSYRPFSGKWPFAFGALLLPLLTLPFAIKLRHVAKPLRWAPSTVLFAAIGASSVIGLAGCGAHNGFFGQQEQSYTVTITVTTGSISHSTNVTLTVE